MNNSHTRERGGEGRNEKQIKKPDGPRLWRRRSRRSRRRKRNRKMHS